MKNDVYLLVRKSMLIKPNEILIYIVFNLINLSNEKKNFQFPAPCGVPMRFNGHVRFL